LAWLKYQLITTTLTFEPGATTAEGTIWVADDSQPEANQEIVLTLSSPSRATLGDSQGTVSVIDDDSWNVQVGDLTIGEGNSGRESPMC
jgi:hypothetical protein